MPTDRTSVAEPLPVIRAATWQPHAAELKHVFLVGDLQQPTPHPFFRRDDFELIVCEYAAGDDGLPHWHQTVDEFEIILHGRLGYRDIASGATAWFTAGDVLSVPRNRCVQRLVREPCRAIAVKLPSASEKTHCAGCARPCADRMAPYVAP